MEFFNVLVNFLGPKLSAKPPTVVESFPQIGSYDETQDMSGEPVQSHASNSSSQVNMLQDGESQSSGSGIQSFGSGAGSGNKSRKRKRGRNEATNELFEQMIRMLKNSDEVIMLLKEKRVNMEERQMELDAQMHWEERQFQL